MGYLFSILRVVGIYRQPLGLSGLSRAAVRVPSLSFWRLRKSAAGTLFPCPAPPRVIFLSFPLSLVRALSIVLIFSKNQF